MLGIASCKGKTKTETYLYENYILDYGQTNEEQTDHKPRSRGPKDKPTENRKREREKDQGVPGHKTTRKNAERKATKKDDPNRKNPKGKATNKQEQQAKEPQATDPSGDSNQKPSSRTGTTKGPKIQ